MDIAEVRTEEGKLYLFVAIDRPFCGPLCFRYSSARLVAIRPSHVRCYAWRTVGALMARAVAVVYHPPAEGLPHIAIILMNGRVQFAQEVPSADAGDALLTATLEELATLADRETPSSSGDRPLKV